MLNNIKMSLAGKINTGGPSSPSKFFKSPLKMSEIGKEESRDASTDGPLQNSIIEKEKSVIKKKSAYVVDTTDKPQDPG